MHDEGMVGGRWGSRGSGILLVHKKKVLLLLRSDEVLEPGTWGVPGGAVPIVGFDLYEDDHRSAIREAAEEIGFSPRGKVLDTFVWKEERFVYTTFLVQASKKERRRRPALNWENDDWGWFDLGEAATLNLHFGARAALAAFATKIGTT